MAEKLVFQPTEENYRHLKNQLLEVMSQAIDEILRIPLGLDEEDNEETRMKKYINSCCRVSEGLEVSSSVLFRKYVQWCSSNSIQPTGHDAFSKLLNSMAINRQIRGIRHKKKQGGSYWYGIGLKQINERTW